MPNLVFKAADVRRVVEHSIAAPKQGRVAVDYDPEGAITKPAEAPAVLLVHDQGVYLMSNGEPADLLDPAKPGRYVAYAKGCHPQKDADWWDTACALVGGDDFGEVIPEARLIKQMIDKGAPTVEIELQGEHIALTFGRAA